jgi:type II secretory pathway component PulK
MKPHRYRSRNGTVLVCVLACLAVVTASIAVSVQHALQNRSTVRIHRQWLQTQFLCEAGVLRAKQKLLLKPSYAGESWKPKLTSSSVENTTVEIQVEFTDDSARLIKVIARLSDSSSPARSVQISRQFNAHVNQSSSQESK